MMVRIDTGPPAGAENLLKAFGNRTTTEPLLNGFGAFTNPEGLELPAVMEKVTVSGRADAWVAMSPGPSASKIVKIARMERRIHVPPPLP